mmetsp:Transcript_14033/g.30486  ORF Transcript_14033/g.30486 Transcript_14033/m.30486 type:complete len:264 (+) Transcript_14033:144-935(+)
MGRYELATLIIAKWKTTIGTTQRGGLRCTGNIIWRTEFGESRQCLTVGANEHFANKISRIIWNNHIPLTNVTTGVFIIWIKIEEVILQIVTTIDDCGNILVDTTFWGIRVTISKQVYILRIDDIPAHVLRITARPGIITTAFLGTKVLFVVRDRTCTGIHTWAFLFTCFAAFPTESAFTSFAAFAAFTSCFVVLTIMGESWHHCVRYIKILHLGEMASAFVDSIWSRCAEILSRCSVFVVDQASPCRKYRRVPTLVFITTNAI